MKDEILLVTRVLLMELVSRAFAPFPSNLELLNTFSNIQRPGNKIRLFIYGVVRNQCEMYLWPYLARRSLLAFFG